MPIRIVDYNRFVLRQHKASLGKTCVALVMAGAASGCNQESYPITASVCDRWCDVNFNKACPAQRQNSPADCVVECEHERKPEEPQCVPFFGSLVECLGNLAPGRSCSDEYGASCLDEMQTTIDCIIENSVPNASKLCVDWCKANNRQWGCTGASSGFTAFEFRTSFAQDCVANCVLNDFPNEPDCVPAFGDVVECLGKIPIEEVCNPTAAGIPGALICAEKLAAVLACEVDTSYPDVPTPCDDWCNTQSLICPGDIPYFNGRFDRTSCVTNCNATVLPKKTECMPLFVKWTQCRNNPSTACYADAGLPCADSYAALGACDN